MYCRCLLGCTLLVIATQLCGAAEDPIFSGPQVGEKLPPLAIKTIKGEAAGETVDVVAQADGGPLLVVFFHSRTRPAFGLMRAVMQYAAAKSDAGLHSTVVFLTADPTETEKWIKAVDQYLPKGVRYGVSLEGQEGPGAYGLNRNVTLTVIVGDEGRTTANFALVQPSLQADGAKILHAIAEVTGGGEVPSIEELTRERTGGREPAATSQR